MQCTVCIYDTIRVQYMHIHVGLHSSIVLMQSINTINLYIAVFEKIMKSITRRKGSKKTQKIAEKMFRC